MVENTKQVLFVEWADRMNQEQLKASPQQFDRFVHILEQRQLNHAIFSFQGISGRMEMALFLSKSLFCTEKTGCLMSLAEIAS